jgi:hypothetical protein
LQASAVVRKLADPIKDEVYNLLSDCVVSASKIVRGIFLAGNQLLWMEELTVSPSAHFIDDSRLQVDEDTTRDMLASTGLAEKGVESVVTSAYRLIAWHLTIWLDAMFQTEQFPASVTNLDSCLPNVDANGLTHCFG